LIDAMPEDQRASVMATLMAQANAADNVNAGQSAFTIGEEATHHMENTFTWILRHVRQLQGMRPKP
jgi:hypothetical protein